MCSIEEKELIDLIELVELQKNDDDRCEIKCVVRYVEIIHPDTNKKKEVWRMEFTLTKMVRGKIQVQSLYLFKGSLDERFFKRLNGVEKFARKVGIKEFTVITEIASLV